MTVPSTINAGWHWILNNFPKQSTLQILVHMIKKIVEIKKINIINLEQYKKITILTVFSINTLIIFKMFWIFLVLAMSSFIVNLFFKWILKYKVSSTGCKLYGLIWLINYLVISSLGKVWEMHGMQECNAL